MKKIFSTSWSIIVNFVVLAVILLLLTKMSTAFEKIIVNLLLMFYIQISHWLRNLGFFNTTAYYDSTIQFSKIKEVLKIDADEFEKENIKALKENISKSEKTNNINMIFQGILQIIIIYNLIVILLAS